MVLRRGTGASLVLFLGIGLLGISAFSLRIPAERVPAVYPEQPPVAHTGGFGEPTCHRCHFDQPLNAPGGALTLGGIPEAYVPGERYRVTVRLARAGVRRGGFQVSARFADGRQAGSFEPIDDRVTVVWEDSTAVAYAQHTLAGTRLAGADTARWFVLWTPPDSAGADVVFHAAANAANDDDSELGDRVYAGEWVSRHTPGQE